MGIRLWPQDFERKDHITKMEKVLLRNAARNFSSGHIVVGIDPLGMSNSKVRMGMYISQEKGLVTFSIYQGDIQTENISMYIKYVEMVEDRVYDRLIDSKLLIVRNGNYKLLKFPYKHIIIFPEENNEKFSLFNNELNQLYNYATFDFFRPITSSEKEKTISQNEIFSGIRKFYDETFSEISDLECRAIFERLAPEYTVIMNEVEEIKISEKNIIINETDLRITGNELEFKTFFFDEYQVSQVNDMGKGHRVILANPGAGKSVLLLSKAFKYASLDKKSLVLLTCYNNNLAESYKFKRACANFGENRNLTIMTFHKLVKKIYEDHLHIKIQSNIATNEEIIRCIKYIKEGKVKFRFKYIFIDEVQNFDPLYLELCYSLLEDTEDHVFLMAGDLNQAVRSLSRKGDVPWKRIYGANLDYTGRVKYIEKNYRNSKAISEYIYNMLTIMNQRLEMLNLINSMEYEYNSFSLGTNPTIALNVKTGLNKMNIMKEVICSINEITSKYKLSYSSIAILFPVRQKSYLKYHFLFWLQEALDRENIPYSMIISSNNEINSKKKYSQTTGIVISTIESSLGLDFKAVILAGLYPYNYVFSDNKRNKEIKSWNDIKKMSEIEQNLVQSQLRSIYTACSRARDVLYVLSDLNPDTPMEEVLKNQGENCDE